MTTQKTMTAEEQAARKARSDRLNRIMWAHICGCISLLGYIVGFEGTFIPLGFGVLGAVLAWQLRKEGETRNAATAGALIAAGIALWLAYNWGTIQHYLGG